MILEPVPPEVSFDVAGLVIRRREVESTLEKQQQRLVACSEAFQDAITKESRTERMKKKRRADAAKCRENYNHVAATYREVRESFVVLTAARLLCDWLGVEETAALESALATESIDERRALLDDLVNQTCDDVAESDVWTGDDGLEPLSASEIHDFVHAFFDDLTELPDEFDDATTHDLIPDEAELTDVGPLSEEAERKNDLDESPGVDWSDDFDV
ncbi:hypothetical protein EFA46_015130 (plasmid) [Halarchaeum sp. CBA1220]|uniref:hypothetical protein n=1 Tax=Halarchaeum sp. CBA1220 TaxID=1853682 RepID=UPI000F3A9D70|nr:hypothetical protein [Halarchaeum sp. CBA1220]QLC35560.1 hypothetical protein EFA46_015130 [Halarchaeum sp. CBA1220]